jgi:decaprenyl-phosphate phosphoribosyltransferase
LEINSAVADDQAAAVPRPFRMSRWLSAAVREARPRQWLKNLLVLAAPLAGATTGRPGGLAYAVAAFLAFGCASASVYYVNDIIDAERDRRHPVKCSRPIASGDLPVRDAIVVAVTLAFLAAGSGFVIGAPLLSAVTGGYLVSSAFYSTRGKHIPYLEMLLVASGFVLRVLAGADALAARVLGQALVIRRHHVERLARRAQHGGSGPLDDAGLVRLKGADSR